MSFRDRPLTHTEAVRNGRSAGRRSGQVRGAQARQRAVLEAAAAIREAGQGAALVDVLELLYRRAYAAGGSARRMQDGRDRRSTELLFTGRPPGGPPLA